MKIAITGGTGFVGRHIARVLAGQGHELVLIARGRDKTDPAIIHWPGTRWAPMDLENPAALAAAMTGCAAVVHCAGINREIGSQTFRKVHVEGTAHVIEAARLAGVGKMVLISFLRARPHGGSGYHESKFCAEELVRESGLDYTILRCGVIYGQGDHLLNHLSHAFHTFPIFALVGFKDRPIRPNAVEDIARIVEVSLREASLRRKTVAVVGPEELTLRGAVRRVARVANKRPLMFPLPVWFHYGLAWCLERIMKVPMVSTAQVRMLVEGLAEPALACDPLPPELAPRIPFNAEQIRKGLPAPGPFTRHDLRGFPDARPLAAQTHARRVFFEMP